MPFVNFYRKININNYVLYNISTLIELIGNVAE